VVQQLSNEMDDLFDAFFYGRQPMRRARPSELRSLWTPEVEVREEPNQLRISVDLPGISKDAVKVDIHEGVLSIQGERREERNEGDEKQGFRRSERRYGSFYRSIVLPEGADAEHAQANMKEGVLEIAIPLAQRAKGKRLEIQG
jgi:HSP20 family protein